MKEQEKAIQEIIKKYGEVIDLKKAPYLIAEIIRNYGSHFGGGVAQESGPVPGSHGTPPPPPPAPQGNPFQQMFVDIRNELVNLSGQIKALSAKVDTLKK